MNRKIVPAVCTLGLIFSNAQVYAINNLDETMSNVSTNSGKKSKESEVSFKKNSTAEIVSGYVNIMDVNLLVAINESIGKDDVYSQIKIEDMESLENLDISNRNIISLSGIEYAKNLKTIDASGNNIHDITPFESLKLIKELNLESNSISDIKPLSSMEELEILNLSENSVVDISSLKNLEKLIYADLSNQNIIMDNRIVSNNYLSLKNPLKSMEGNVITPEFISDEGIVVGDEIIWKSLEEDIDLVEISFEDTYNKASGTSVVFGGKISCPVTIESKIEFKDKELVKEINKTLGKTNLDSPILKSEILRLEVLKIDNPYLYDISGLENAINLKELTLRNSSVKDFSLISKLYNIEKLNLSNNDIEDVGFLSNLKNIVDLNLSDNKIYTASNLRLSSLNTLDISNNFISDIGFLSDLLSIEVLNLNENNISDISYLSEINSLMKVNIENQDIYLPVINSQIRDIKINNPIVGINNNTISPYYISSNGIVEENYISWSDSEDIDGNVSMEFRDDIAIGGQLRGVFSGKVIQPVEMDLFADVDYISLSLSTNQITFDSVTGLEDVEMLGAVEVSVDSNKAYDVSVSMPSEIESIDGKSQFGVDALSIKNSNESNYYTFKNINEKILLVENMTSGVNKHVFDFRLNRDVITEKGSYRAVVKFEVNQK